ncbi:hypothetical protein C0Z18_17010 [Trinickia dabaoshanensis]|uniref:Uncharacterized protein n=1 Tax=Trinickia dabaoshanensis TaxID=564714 RepID=A0A2N7VME4_9BURK|nr:hypothetical protein [Trinickia dabaoshanensis]PMS18285.1 hypothetical protein C0Z18_17010 [Trinickia dabaoshanensis]
MKKASLTVLFSLSLLAGAAYAQTDEGGVTMSTDPAKAADIEQRAQALQQQQDQMPMQQHETMPMHHKPMHHKPMHKHAAKGAAKAAGAAPASGASQ